MAKRKTFEVVYQEKIAEGLSKYLSSVGEHGAVVAAMAKLMLAAYNTSLEDYVIELEESLGITESVCNG